MILFFRKIAVYSLVLLLIVSFGGYVTRVEAAVIPAFGGLEIFAVPCTCTAGSFAMHVFSPLYINSSVPLAGGLTGVWGTTFAHYALHPAAYALGGFLPGVSPCLVGVPPYCIPFSGLGIIDNAFTGTSI